MSVLVKVAGHITGQVYTKVLFTVCYKSEFCLELSYFLLSYPWSGRLFMLFWYSWRSGPWSCGQMKCLRSKSSHIRCPWSSPVSGPGSCSVTLHVLVQVRSTVSFLSGGATGLVWSSVKSCVKGFKDCRVVCHFIRSFYSHYHT